jgi:(4S)-4-hydroxy-5-phosphonooxypentane-2,3-dione isomerase
MSRVALIVEFKLKPDAWAKFNTIIRAHAAGTLADEPGCEQFDVLQPETDGTPDYAHVMLVEIYRDAAAFGVHTKSQRLVNTRAAYADLVESRKITRCSLD